jgi:AcrR family transcriptional regulator
MPRIALKPRKLPRQERSQLMVEAILQAAARVLERESLAGFNTNRVAEVAGVSVGSLYQYFPNKESLITALIDQAQTALARDLEALVAQLEGKSLQESLYALAQAAVAQQFEKPLFAAALDHEERRLPIQARLAQADQRLASCIEQLLARHRAALAPNLPASAAADCLTISKALVDAQAGKVKAPPPDLVDRVYRAVLGYLTVNHT